MALNNSTADAAAEALCSALGVADGATIDQYKVWFRSLYSSLKADIQISVTVTSVGGVTVGGGVSGPGAGTGVCL